MTSSELSKIVSKEQLKKLQDGEVFKKVVNQEPPKQWIKSHPIAKGVKYLPIDKVELMLDTLLEGWRVEIKDVSQLAQSIVCTVRVHYKNPVTSEWSFQDGVGATPLKTKKGSTAADLGSILNDAVATGAPAAKAFAIKDAADHIGNLFGRNINRKDALGFSGIYEKDRSRIDAALQKLKESKTLNELKNNYSTLGSLMKDPEVVSLKNKLKKELGNENS